MRWSVLSGGAALLAVAGLLSACAGGLGGATTPKVAMAPISFNEIPGWSDDKHAEALAAFKNSCPKLTTSGDTRIVTDGGEKVITQGEWGQICGQANTVKTGDERGARRFFEDNFRPLVVQTTGSFTGYFEPELRGSRAPSRLFTVPVYRRPPDLTDQPYYTRAEIEQGALKGKGLEIVWVQDPVALYEVQVQGSGRVHLAEGGTLSLGFDGSNNRPYTALSTVLSDMGVMKRENATWPAIRDWLKRHPQQGRDVMRKNERYIFFKDTRLTSASGSEGVTLTAQRSLAVDTTFTPYGTPIWIDTARPVAGKAGATEPYRRLMIAQDSGTAIKGPARGDVFFGSTPQAADWAGRMVSNGKAIVLIPNKG
ncbi:membrane-bound lytic murein transglycosylase A [Enhydrobacter aerosaccus]|uniref:peptidoglycan lytic exotransglycosylase n=1 Tax=Enhydrobacter aerosaccus TaxID=225324 RepID=A0A1T4QPV9_9HYPH|nr:MltA domain-containing protein [Enhydrobacter aerosaccus]SKA05735.1 membrane-bound lytic murein transglycosylase A [Enhydrobacter aerosaccus]